jgi:raffinose/stachyose/melibiose transport system permease protein
MRKKTGKEIFKSIIYVFIWVYFLLSIYPIIWMVFYSLKNNEEIFVTNPFGFPTHFRIENYLSAISRYNILLYFRNSVIVTVMTIIISMVFSLMFSYAAARMVWKFSQAARIYLSIGLFIPVQIIFIPLIILVRDLRLLNTHWSLIVPYAAFNLSISSLIFYSFYRTIPMEMEESAVIDGAGIYRAFYIIILPLMGPAIATVTIFIFLGAWNEFSIALILVSRESLKTLPLGLIVFQGQFSTNWGGMGAALTMASLPTIIIYLLMSEQFEKSITVSSAQKG